uniref:Ribonuclease VapC n=1 Tax=Cyanothece sp. (strain PCC 7425 / ATCC 29141) TaxID=395961 RepID=B8HZM5_CYAP4
MALLNAIQGDRVYLDTNIWIYALEGYPAFSQELTNLFQAIDQGNLSAVTSELSLAELLVKPIQTLDVAQQDTYKQAITSSQYLSVIPVQRDILINAAILRATTSLKLPDAIHAATALITQCSTFLTNDQRFQTITGLKAVLLSQAITP